MQLGQLNSSKVEYPSESRFCHELFTVLALPCQHLLLYIMKMTLNGCLSSHGQQLIMGYSPLIILLREVSLWLIGSVYVVAMGVSVDHLLLHCKFSHT